MGSSKVPSSAQSWSFFRDGRPAKSWGIGQWRGLTRLGWRWILLTSSTLPTRVFCCSSSVTPLAVFMLVFSMLRSFGTGDISSVHGGYNIACELPEAILRV